LDYLWFTKGVGKVYPYRRPMRELTATVLQHPVVHEAAVDVIKKETYISYRSVEEVLNIPEDSFRKILASKAFKDFAGKEVVSGKFKAKLLGTFREGTPLQNVITTELFMRVVAFVDTAEAKHFLVAHAEFGYHTNVLTSAGIVVDQAYADSWWKHRAMARKDFQPMLASWHKKDGESIPYAGFVQNFKRACGVVLKHPDLMDAMELHHYDSMIKAYDAIRGVGLDDKAAREHLKAKYAKVSTSDAG
jgi:hypothetical protein